MAEEVLAAGGEDTKRQRIGEGGGGDARGSAQEVGWAANKTIRKCSHHIFRGALRNPAKHSEVLALIHLGIQNANAHHKRNRNCDKCAMGGNREAPVRAICLRSGVHRGPIFFIG